MGFYVKNCNTVLRYYCICCDNDELINRIYHRDFHKDQKGQVGISLNINWSEPKDDFNSSHVIAAQRHMEFNLGWFANPVLVNGDYPQVMKDFVRKNKMAPLWNVARYIYTEMHLKF